jgi:hypothetical protein
MIRFALLAIIMLSPALVHAQTPPASAPLQPPLDTRGTADDQKACDNDARKLCRDVLSQGDFAVLGCLQQNRQKLTRSCQGVLTKYGQ